MVWVPVYTNYLEKVLTRYIDDYTIHGFQRLNVRRAEVGCVALPYLTQNWNIDENNISVPCCACRCYTHSVSPMLLANCTRVWYNVV